jgi:transposase
MVRQVRAGKSMRSVAAEWGVSVGKVAFWVERAEGKRLDRVDFGDRPSGCSVAWNRLDAMVEQRVLELRRELRESILGEYGAEAIQQALQAETGSNAASRASINRVLARHGLQDRMRRARRPAPPRGWYLPAVAAGQSELDSFDLIEDLKIEDGPLASILTGTSLHGGLVDAWPLSQASAKLVLPRLEERWEREGLPQYAQFDNGTQFQGAHQWPDTIGRISRLCLALDVIPVFAPPREPGFQNAIESFNALWQTKVWQRYHFVDLLHLEAVSARYTASHRARSVQRRDGAPARRPYPKRFKLNLNAKPSGTMIFLRRANESNRVHLLGRSFEMPDHWKHRLARCEVDLRADEIRFFALRRKDPSSQPLLVTLPYHRKHQPFKGEL